MKELPSLFYDKFSQGLEGALMQEQQASWDKFLLQVTRAREEYQYFPKQKLLQAVAENRQEAGTLSAQFQATEQDPVIVFEGSRLAYTKNLPSQMVVLPLQEAIAGSYSAFVKHRMQVQREQEIDPLALLNNALCSQGVFFYMPPSMRSAKPIKFVFLPLSGEMGSARILGLIAAGVQVEIVSAFVGQEGMYNAFMDLALEEGARVSHVQHTALHARAWGFSSLRATLKKNSDLSSSLASFGGDCWRNDYRISLVGPEARATLAGIGVMDAASQLHVHVHMDHAAPSCTSSQLFKTALFGSSRASFTGKIYVRQVAQKTSAYQLNKNLLLSNQAMVYSKPNLEIFADDVKASHGATIAQLEEDQLHYLRSRGIDGVAAAALLTKGFCAEILQAMPIDSVQEALEADMETFLQKQSLDAEYS